MSVSDEDLIDPEDELAGLETGQSRLNDTETCRRADLFVLAERIGWKIGRAVVWISPYPVLVMPIAGWFICGWVGLGVGVVAGFIAFGLLWQLADFLGGIPLFGEG